MERQPVEGPLSGQHMADILATLGAESPGERIVLRALNGSSAGCCAELIHSLVVGKASAVDLVLTDPGLSRQHARVTRLRDGRFELQDLGSSNGTLVDGRRIESCVLKAGSSFVLECLLGDGSLGVEVQITQLPPGATVSASEVARTKGTRAAARLREGDRPGAIAEATAALELDPLLADAHGTRAAARLHDAATAALEDCRRAIELSPAVALFHCTAAEAHLQLGQPREAIAASDRALLLDPLQADAWACRGEARRLQGEFRAALEDCTKALELRPRLVMAWRTRAQAREAMADREQAAVDYRRVLDLQPEDPAVSQALERLSSSYRDRGLTRVTVISGQSSGCHMDIDESLMLGLASTADLVLTDLGLSRQHARLTRLGNGHFQLEDLASANGTFVGDHRIDRCELQEGNSFRLGCIRDDGSLGIEVKLTRVTDPGGADGTIAARLLCNRALARLREGDPQGAIEACSGAIALDDSLPGAYANRAAARRRVGETAGALADCSRAIELSPGEASSYLARSEVHLQDGHADLAANDCDRAVQLNPGIPDAWACRGEARRRKGDLRGAVEDCTRAIGLSADLTRAWSTRARAADDLGNLGQARGDYQRLLDLEPDNEMAVEGVRRLASSSLPDLSELPDSSRKEALAAVERLIETEKRWGPDHPDLARQLNQYANLVYRVGAYRVARPLYERAIAIMESARGSEDLEVATYLCNLAYTLIKAKLDDARARAVAGRALAIREKLLGAEHGEVAAGLEVLAFAHQHNAASRPMLLRALAIREKLQGTEHLAVVGALQRLAHTHFHEGAYAAACPLYERAVDIAERTLGPAHIELAMSLENLAEARYRLADNEGAVRLLERSIPMREGLQGAEHQDLARPLLVLGHIHNSAQRYEPARLLYERALAIREKQLPADHLDIASCLSILAELHVKLQQPEAARPLYQRALAQRVRVQGAQHADVASLRAQMRKLPPPPGKSAIAEAEAALDKLRLVKGAEHHEVASALSRLADLHRLGGDPERARSLHERALAIRQQVLGPNHPDVAESLNNLALLYFSTGDHEKAASLQERALAIRHQPAAAANRSVPGIRVADESPRLRAFLEAAVQQVHGDRGLVLIPGDHGEMEVQAAVGVARNQVEDPQSGVSHMIIARVAGEKQPLITHNAMQDPRYSATTSVVISGIRSVLCVPLLFEDRLLGVVYVDNPLQRGGFRTEQLQQLEELAARVAGTLVDDSTTPLQKPVAAAAALTPLQKHLQRAIREVGGETGLILVPTGEAQDMQVRAAIGVDPDTVWAVGRVSRSVLLKVVAERQPVLTHNAEQDPRFMETRSVILTGLRSVMCVPLLQEDALVGLLYLDNPIRSGAFKTAQLQQLQVHAVRLCNLLTGRPEPELPAPEVMQACLETAVRRVNANRGLVLVPAADGGDMEVLAAVGIDAVAGWNAINHAVVRQVSDKQEPLLSHNAIREPGDLGEPRLAGLRSVICCPLLHGVRLVGMLYIDNPIRLGALKLAHLTELADSVAELTQLLCGPAS